MEGTVLLVEDDENLSFILAENLEIEGLNVLKLQRGEDVEPTVRCKNIDIVLMDVDLRGKMNGFETAENLRLYYPDLPIIFTTGKTHYKDMERGLRLGNVDYQKKPYGSREVIARIGNLLKRVSTDESSVYTYKGFVFNPVEHIMLIDRKEIRLTKTETAFFSILCDRINSVVSKEELATTLWGKEFVSIKDHSLNNLSYKIRKNLEGNKYIDFVTMQGVGFKLVEKK